jgi:hypothetical protein
MTWWWEFFDDRNMTAYFKSVSTINKQMMDAGKGSFENIKILSGTLESYAVRCGDVYFVYVLNNGNATHIREISITSDRSDSYMLRSFNPYEEKFMDHSTMKANGGNIVFDPGNLNVHEDRIFILTPEQQNVLKTGSK